ncbi:PA3496 family putative envelope integrity protein [Marinibactrum halimedae]|nr:hypothetical protein [Marinibactrum halimedae]MCD9459230.1 hypothetical protein [Marinibactrum halimedae]
MRDELLKNDGIDDAVINLGEELDAEEFTAKNQHLDARRRLEDALEQRRLSREIQEFDFDFEEDDYY